MSIHCRGAASTGGIRCRAGFTILELLIATAATLVIMGALTRAFGLVGNSIRDSRAEVQLSAQSRDLMFTLRSELGQLTASMDPSDPESGSGYFVYYEGPTTDSTTTTFYGSGPTFVQAGYFPLSRWGDTDDLLAFTVKAPQESPFTGTVPWGVLEAARASSRRRLRVSNGLQPQHAANHSKPVRRGRLLDGPANGPHTRRWLGLRSR